MVLQILLVYTRRDCQHSPVYLLTKCVRRLLTLHKQVHCRIIPRYFFAISHNHITTSRYIASSFLITCYLTQSLNLADQPFFPPSLLRLPLFPLSLPLPNPSPLPFVIPSLNSLPPSYRQQRRVVGRLRQRNI